MRCGLTLARGILTVNILLAQRFHENFLTLLRFFQHMLKEFYETPAPILNWFSTRPDCTWRK